VADDAYDYGELLVLQHGELTGPSALVPTLDGRAGRRPWHTVHLDRGEALPEPDERRRGVVVLGGFMGVGDQAELPWLTDEIAWLAAEHERGTPILGICLGAQLLGTALGGAVRTREVPEVGVFALDRTEAGREDEIAAGWPDGGHVLLMHDDEVHELPPGAVPLLTGNDGTPMWRVGTTTYAVQFHPEASADTLAAWVERPKGAASTRAAGLEPEEFVADVRRREAHLHAAGLSLVGRFLDAVVGADDPTPRHRRS
jgi:GMP synthase (glutamine-hydrolysing)